MTSTIELDANEHPIESITVYKANKAKVVRTFKLSLGEGQNEIQIRYLPGSIDTKSARVTGLGDAQLFDVVCSIGPGITEIDSESTAEEIRKLNAKRNTLERDLDDINDIYETMVDYSKSLSGDSVPPERAESFFESLCTHSRDISSARADLEEEILQLSRQIDLLSSCKTMKQGKTNGEVTVVIMAKKTTNIELRLTYLVRNATWSAAYELHATTEAGVPASSVSLHYRARITQSTGEDWTDVGLTLSTAGVDISNQAIPVLGPTKIRPSSFGGGPMQVQRQQVPCVNINIKRNAKKGVKVQAESNAFGAPAAQGGPFGATTQEGMPPPPVFESSCSERGASDAAPADDWLDIESDGDEDIGADLMTATSLVHESPVALTYHVEGELAVPSDGVPHQVPVAVLPFEAKIMHVTVPKLRPVAYLQASVKNTSDYRLLPGPMHAFVDNSFVSKSAMVSDVAPGDAFSCTLGADPATRIRYARTSKRADDGGADRERSAFSEQWTTTTYRSCTTITNGHSFALRGLVFRDGVPVSEDKKRARVVLRRPEGLAVLEKGEELEVCKVEGEKRTVRWSNVVDGKGGKKEGLFEWVAEVGAGKEITIETEWDVKTQLSLSWVESA